VAGVAFSGLALVNLTAPEIVQRKEQETGIELAKRRLGKRATIEKRDNNRVHGMHFWLRKSL